MVNERSTSNESERSNEREYPRSNVSDSHDSNSQDSNGSRLSTADIANSQRSSAKEGMVQAETPGSAGNMTLIQEQDAGDFRARWTSIQTKFIDEPRKTVSDADQLVADVIQSLARRFAEEHQTLESQWQSGSEVSTEDLRQSMQRYRAFFERLLAA